MALIPCSDLANSTLVTKAWVMICRFYGISNENKSKVINDNKLREAIRKLPNWNISYLICLDFQMIIHIAMTFPAQPFAHNFTFDLPLGVGSDRCKRWLCSTAVLQNWTPAIRKCPIGWHRSRPEWALRTHWVPYCAVLASDAVSDRWRWPPDLPFRGSLDSDERVPDPCYSRIWWNKAECPSMTNLDIILIILMFL